MKLNVMNALRHPGEIFDFEKDISIESAGGYETVGPLHISLQYTYDQSKVTVFGSANIDIKGCCDRCLKDAIVKLEFDFQEYFYKQENKPNEDAYTFDKNFVDLEEPINNHIELYAPMKLLCSESCKGLCKICGHDLNESDCDHVIKD